MKYFILILLFLPVFALGQEKININTATLEQLDTLTGIGPAYAQRIIDNRPFSSINDLLKVKGIGEKTLEKIKEQGLASVEEKPEVILNEVKNPNNNPRDPSPTTAQDDFAEATPLQTYPGGVFFSKVMPSPVGPDSENEWIKIYNSNNSEIDLTGWVIKDTTGGIKEYVINSTISALGHLALKRPETKITLNNDGDGLILLNPNEEIVDSVNFGKAVQGESYIKTNSKWAWTTTPTKKSNKVEVELPPLGQKGQEESTEVGAREVKLVENIKKDSKSSVLFVGFLIALCSAISFLIIKNNLKNFWY